MQNVPLFVLGFLFGLRHTLDVDHLIAMSALVSRSRSLKRSAVLGALWGLGHTAALLGAGVLVVLVSWQPQSEDQPLLEGLVGLVLVVIGCRVIWRLWRGQLHSHVHEHGERRHRHLHIHVPDEQLLPHSHHEVAAGRAPFLVGIVHGLAGSAAFVLLTAKFAATRGAGFMFLAMFGLGTVAGMAAMSMLMSLPFSEARAARLGRLPFLCRGLAGALSVAFGLYLLCEVGVELTGG